MPDRRAMSGSSQRDFPPRGIIGMATRCCRELVGAGTAAERSRSGTRLCKCTAFSLLGRGTDLIPRRLSFRAYAVPGRVISMNDVPSARFAPGHPRRIADGSRPAD
jgi:hypothetical protein